MVDIIKPVYNFKAGKDEKPWEKREEYLNKLKLLKDKNIIKIVTGIRRCGKSTLLIQFRDWLIEHGVKKSQIILKIWSMRT